MDEIFDRIIAVNKTGVGVLMVEQNAKQALALAHSGYVLATGGNRFADSAAEPAGEPRSGGKFSGWMKQSVAAITSVATCLRSVQFPRAGTGEG